MTASQALFWLGITALAGWAPLILLVWALSKSQSGVSPVTELLVTVRGGLTAMIQGWPKFSTGQKQFLVAASLSGGAGIIGLSRLGVEAVEWASINLGGMAPQEALAQPPLGSWWLIWALQAGLACAFFAWLQFKRQS